MTKAESAILEARDPGAYIDASLKARIAPAAKARLARQWMEKTGYSKEDILYARNRHPYWKKKKMAGSAERTRRRLSTHDYSGGSSISWKTDQVRRFLDLNIFDKSGRYEHRDWELAELFGASIPSIQYMRRKFRRATEILGSQAPKARLVEYLTVAESVLVRGAEAVEEIRNLRAKSAGAKGSGPKVAGAKPPGSKALPSSKSATKKVPPQATVGKPSAKPSRKPKTPASKSKVSSKGARKK